LGEGAADRQRVGFPAISPETVIAVAISPETLITMATLETVITTAKMVSAGAAKMVPAGADRAHFDSASARPAAGITRMALRNVVKAPSLRPRASMTMKRPSRRRIVST
jgi:hypothetical protein